VIPLKWRKGKNSFLCHLKFVICSLENLSCETMLQKLERVLSWVTLHFVGWVEPIPGFVGFLRLHFAGVIAKCETQQRPISEPSPKNFYFDLTGRFFGRRMG
jgi:hypothetical protein